MSDELSFKQIAFDLDTKKMGEHFPRYNIGYSKLKNTLQKEGFEHSQGSVYISKEKMDVYTAAVTVKNVAKQQPWLGDCCKDIKITNTTKDNYDYLPLIRATAAEAKKSNQNTNANGTSDALQDMIRNAPKSAKQKSNEMVRQRSAQHELE